MKEISITLLLLFSYGCNDNEHLETFLDTPSIIQASSWFESSAPINQFTGKTYSQKNRAKLNFYNPYAKIKASEIWPDQYNDQQFMDILLLISKMRSHQYSVQRDSIWSGIIYPFKYVDFDQTQSQYFEIWLKGNNARLSIDLGLISEDRNGDNRMNTEDIPDTTGFTFGNGILDDGEDIGLDGCTDEYEDGWGNCLRSDTNYTEYFSMGETNVINTFPDVDPLDPNGDNWYYVKGSSDYSHINGSEGNGMIDSEDINKSGFINRINLYFTATINLNDSTFFISETIKDGQLTGWKLFRIPLNEFDLISADEPYQWNEIHYLRLCISSIDSVNILSIAKIDFK